MSLLQDMSREEIEMEMTPMIDVTFLLLIFFLCTLKFKALEGKLDAYLPKDAGIITKYDPVEKVEVHIRVVQPGVKVFPVVDGSMGRAALQGLNKNPVRYEYEGRELRYELGPRSTGNLETLAGWVQMARQQDSEARSTIRCAPDAIYGEVVPVLDCLIAAGFERISFAAEERAESK